MENDRLISITIKDIKTRTELRGEVFLSKMEQISNETGINVLDTIFDKINKELDILLKQ